MSLGSRIAILQDRAAMLHKARSFFAERGILEVDTPALSQAAPVDLHIDVMSVVLKNGEKRYLHTSPEYRMKRLLSEGMEHIYQISNVFREGECSDLHNPEFCMVEWYESKIDFKDFIRSTVDFICLFLGDVPFSMKTYRDIFLDYLGIDYVAATTSDIVQVCKKHHLSHKEMESWDKDTLLQFAMSFLIEPKLGREELTVVMHYPSTQAALAKTHIIGDEMVAERYEIYYEGIELCNGYHELADSKEQHERLAEQNVFRLQNGKDELPIDERFIAALAQNFPDCCGVAVGFDRLMLLRHKKKSLKDILPFYWENT